MKFLKKQPNSSILQQKLSYNATKDNSLLRKLLEQEQQGFCVSRLEGREAGAKHGAKRTLEGGDPKRSVGARPNKAIIYL
jgi:hypothetical protein